jgi:aminoglycoside 3-N-acetyltransferase I
MDVSIKQLSADDLEQFIELVNLFAEVFELRDFFPPEKKHLQKLLKQENFLVFVALENNTVVGGITAYSMTQYYTTRDAVFIYDLAVAESSQRKGIGKKLIDALNVYCKKTGVEVTFLEADEPDTHAIEFYRSTGAVEAKGYFFSYPLNDSPTTTFTLIQ